MLTNKGISFIKYNKSYLAVREKGTTKMVGFLQKSQAHDIVKNMKTMHFEITPTRRDSYMLKLNTEARLQRPLMRKCLKVDQKDIVEAMLFTKLNSIDLVVIDDMITSNSNTYELKSNYASEVFLDDSLYVNHMENVFNGHKIDYAQYVMDLAQAMFDEGIDGDDDEDDSHF